MIIIFESSCLHYAHKDHPESPHRIRNIYHSLINKSEIRWSKPNPASIHNLHLAHTRKHISRVQDFQTDTPNYPNIYQHALNAVGAAITAANLSIKEGSAFSLSRPPGHHAGPENIEGFCYFNNIAIAILKILEEGRVKKAAILDIDAHHGNGTENIVFGNDHIIFCSLHQQGIYPGTGIKSKNNIHNFPLPANTSYNTYKEYLRTSLQIIKRFQPDILGVSVGFDTFIEDPLTNLSLKISDYRLIGESIKKLNLPTFFVLEGGYSDKVGKCAASFFNSFI